MATEYDYLFLKCPWCGKTMRCIDPRAIDYHLDYHMCYKCGHLCYLENWELKKVDFPIRNLPRERDTSPIAYPLPPAPETPETRLIEVLPHRGLLQIKGDLANLRNKVKELEVKKIKERAKSSF